MKTNFVLFVLIAMMAGGCRSSDNSHEFIAKTKGRYLYNSDEIVEVYFKKDQLYMKWRGAEKIKPMKISDDIFYVKEMNKKIRFLTNPKNNLDYIGIVPKGKDKMVTYDFRKLEKGELIPNEYLENNEFDKALIAYKAIKEKDSLDPTIKEKHLNILGYTALRSKKYDRAINIFKINVALYPTSSNVYDSLGDALRRKGDTVNAIINYKKSLDFDSGNARAKRMIKQLEKKD